MTAPLVTIGMPVYNGDEYLAEALSSLLEQTYPAFKLIIYDNASTDQTHKLALAFAARDPRVRVMRQPSTISAVDNFIAVAQQAESEYFCWAAHDDLRNPGFLSSLVEALESQPDAGLAACDCLEIDPDGSFRRNCEATSSLAHAQRADPLERVMSFLKCSPCSSIYGLFRTRMLHQHLEVLRHGPTFGADLVFLTHFLAHHPLVFRPLPFLILRGGGGSHSADQFKSIKHFLREMWTFHCALRDAVRGIDPRRGRVRLLAARWKLFVRYLTWRPARTIAGPLIQRAMPWLAWFHQSFRLCVGPFARLRRRVNASGPSRILIFGAGKHTRRNLQLIRRAIGRRATIVAVCDDRAQRIQSSSSDLAIVSPEAVTALQPDLILLSSDAYESTLMRRARDVVGSRTPVWALYDLSLESQPFVQAMVDSSNLVANPSGAMALR